MRVAAGERWLLPCAIFFLTVVVFLPALENGFVNWDDYQNLIENQSFRGLQWSNIWWMFTTFHLSLYRPLTWLTFALDYLVWGVKPFGYHLTSLLFHAANALLAYFVALRLLRIASAGRDTPSGHLALGAAFAALLFSLHPLRVEAVAWASARNDVVSATFFLLAVWFYLKGTEENTRSSLFSRWVIAATVSYGFCLLAKGAAVTLPVALVVLDVYPLRRLNPDPRTWFQSEFRRVWWEKLPVLLLAIGAGALAFIGKHELGSMQSLVEAGLAARLGQTLYGLVFYLWKTVAPFELSPLYERPIGLGLFDFASMRAGLLVLAATIGFYFLRSRWPALLAGWICYVVILAPVTGLVQSGPQLAADRYSYLPSLGWAILIAGWIAYLWGLRHRVRFGLPLSLGAAAAAVLVGCGFLSWEQTKIWRDSVTLWRHAVSVTPSPMVHYNLGSALELAGDMDGALEHIGRAVALNPAYADAYYSLGKILARRGELEEAEKNYRRAVELNPKDDGAYNGLGLIAAKKGKTAKAMEYFRRAVELNPSNAGMLNNLAIASAGQGKVEEAIRYLNRALEISPSDSATHVNLARVLLQKGDSDMAVQHLRRAAEINPKDGDLHGSLAMIFSRDGKLDEAVKHFRRALEINPKDAGLRANMAVTLAKQSNLDAAKKEFQEALKIQPDLAEAHAGLARILKLQGQTDEAIRHYQEALRLLQLQRANARAQ